MDDFGCPWIPRPTPLASAVIGVIRGSLNPEAAVHLSADGADKRAEMTATQARRRRHLADEWHAQSKLLIICVICAICGSSIPVPSADTAQLSPIPLRHNTHRE